MSRDEIISNFELMKAEVEWEYPIDYAATIDEAIELVKERKVGHWRNRGRIDQCCSVCGETPDCEPGETPKEYDFCPYCGAKMEM